jgi:hypothetical protein
MHISESWQERDPVSPGEAQWFTQQTTGNFNPNVNVVVERGSGLTLEKYREISIANLPRIAPDAKIIASDIVTINGHQAIRLLYMVTYKGVDLTLLGVSIAVPTGFVTATFTASMEDFDSQLLSVQPYLFSLTATQ